MRDHLKEIAALVAQGDTAELQDAAAAALREIEGAIAELQQDAAIIRGLVARYVPASQAVAEGRAAPEATSIAQTHPDTATPRQRWHAMHDAALTVARGRDMVNVTEIEEELKRRGLVFPYRNVHAAIGTVLRDSREFRRLGGGLWEFLGEETGEQTDG